MEMLLQKWKREIGIFDENKWSIDYARMILVTDWTIDSVS